MGFMMQQGPKNSELTSMKFAEKNILGETAIHQIFIKADKNQLLEVSDLVSVKMVDINVTTFVLSNPFHYVAHIADAGLLDIIFSMATTELIMARNQLNESPLSLAIAQDNAEFFSKAVTLFPQIIEMVETRNGLMMQYASLLHDIARSNAQRCFHILKNLCSDDRWEDLCSVRIDEQRPIDVAISSEHNEMYQLFAGYRRDGVPTATWLFALKVAEANLNVPSHLEQIVKDAKNELEFQRTRALWDAQDDTNEFETPVKELSRLSLS